MKTTGIRALLWSAVMLLPGGLAAQPAPPSPAELIARAIAAGNAQDARGWKYTYREDHTQSQLDKNGKPGPPSTRTYEHIMLEGSDYKNCFSSTESRSIRRRRRKSTRIWKRRDLSGAGTGR